MPSVLVCAPSPIREVLVECLDNADPASVAKVHGALEQRVKDAKDAGWKKKQEFLLIVQHVEREELRWLSRGRARFAGGLAPRNREGAEEPAEASRDEEQSNHPLEFRRFDQHSSSSSGTSDKDVLAAIGAYAVPVVFIGSFKLPEEPTTVEDLDRLFLDSSIWHRYVEVSASDGLKQLRERIDEARKWHEEGRFCLSVAVEFLDYSARALRHLYLVRGPDEGNHGDFVALHGFHSESAMARAAVKREEQVRDGLTTFTAGCLLIDDYGNKPLRCLHSDESTLSKRSIVLSELAQRDFEVRVSATYEEAKELLGLPVAGRAGRAGELAGGLKGGGPTVGCPSRGVEPSASRALEWPVDLVFLDYLLDDRESGGRWRGLDLINELAECRSLPFGTAAFGRFWILPVSSFPAIFETEMRRGEATNVEQAYFLAPGADPVCTPKLFRFRVWDLLRTMRNHAEVGPSDLSELLKQAVGAAPHDDPKGKSSKQWLMALHAVLSRRREAFERIDSDASSGSLFAKSLRTSTTQEADRRSAVALDLLIEVLHSIAWGGSLSQIEVLDRLWLADQSISNLGLGEKNRDWKELKSRLKRQIHDSVAPR